MKLLSSITTLALLASVSACAPAYASLSQQLTQTELDAPPPQRACIPPDRFPTAIRLEGQELELFKHDPARSMNLPEQVDLVLLLRSGPFAVAFIHGCAIGVGAIQPKTPAQRIDDGTI